MSFSETLIRERKARGLSQEDLAAKIQVSRQAVSKWETSEAMPDLNKVLSLADALDISLDTLCGRETTPPPPSVEAPVPTTKKRHWLLALVALAVGFLAGALLAGGSSASPLPGDLTVAHISFIGGHPALQYSFTPTVGDPALTYEITFSSPDTEPVTVEAEYEGGVCSGSVVLGGLYTYTVTVSVSNGWQSRNIPTAEGLTFTSNSARWTPLV